MFRKYSDLERQLNDLNERLRKGKIVERQLQDSRFRKAAVEAADETIVLRIREEQIEWLGGCPLLFDEVDNNLKDHIFNPGLAVSQYKLYEWRERFFNIQFPEKSWFTDEGNFMHYLDTVPYQITKKWHEVVSLACSPITEDCRVYFNNDEVASSEARSLFDKSWIVDTVDDCVDSLDFFIKTGSDGDIAYTIDALFSHAPPKLKQLTLRSCLRYEVNISDVSLAVEKTEEGSFDNSDPDLSHLTEEGKNIFKKWRELVEMLDSDVTQDVLQFSTECDCVPESDGKVDEEDMKESELELEYVLKLAPSDTTRDFLELTEDEEKEVCDCDENKGDSKEVNGDDLVPGKYVKKSTLFDSTEVENDEKNRKLRCPKPLLPFCQQVFDIRTRYTGFLLDWRCTYGFIQPDPVFGIHSIFIHMSDISGPKPYWLAPGTRFEFSIDRRCEKPKAVSARVLDFMNMLRNSCDRNYY